MQQDTEPYRYSELLDDEQFIEWVLFPTNDLDAYWNQRIANNPDLSENLEFLRFIIKNLRAEKIQLSEAGKSRIRNDLQKNSQRVYKKQRENFFLRITASVAILLIIGGVWLFRQGQRSPAEIDYQLILTKNNADERQSDNIELILGEDRIEIDSTNVDIVYSRTGEISINSRKIKKSSEVQLNQLIVPYGKISSVTLSDGSRIWVNSGSRLIYPQIFEEEKREIFVEGEVYLDVDRKEQPFLIKTEKLEVRVLGTQFNISTYKDDEEHSVVLVSGSVTIEDRLSSNIYKMHPNQKYTYNTKEGVADVRDVDINKYISWKSGSWALKSEKLIAVLNKLERHYNIIFLYDKDRINEVLVSGKLNLKDNIEDILKAISITTPMNYEIIGETIKLEF